MPIMIDRADRLDVVDMKIKDLLLRVGIPDHHYTKFYKKLDKFFTHWGNIDRITFESYRPHISDPATIYFKVDFGYYQTGIDYLAFDFTRSELHKLKHVLSDGREKIFSHDGITF